MRTQILDQLVSIGLAVVICYFIHWSFRRRCVVVRAPSADQVEEVVYHHEGTCYHLEKEGTECTKCAK